MGEPTLDDGWIGSRQNYASVCSSRNHLLLAAGDGSEGWKNGRAWLSAWEAEDFTNATVRAMREINQDYCPPDYVRREDADAGAEVRVVPRYDGAPAANGQPGGRATGGGSDAVNPDHYKIPGLDVELWDVIEALKLDEDAALAQAFQYIARARTKGSFTEDLKKAIWYLGRRLGCDVEMKERAENESKHR